MKFLRLLGLCCAVFCSSFPAQAAESFEFHDGDRVVLIGNAMIEQEQRFGYWETAITAHYPDRTITFRNLGWSGDTVFGDAQAGFGGRADGFKHLVDHVLALKPTVIIMGYGGVEAFKGKEGAKEFLDGLETLLKALEPTKSRIVFLSPLFHENLGKPFPNPSAFNENISNYRATLKSYAQKHGHYFACLDPDANHPNGPWTHDGLHLTANGYWQTGLALERALGWDRSAASIFLDRQGKDLGSKGIEIKDRRPDGISLTFVKLITAPRLPYPGFPQAKDSRPAYATLRVPDLPEKKYTLLMDFKPARTAAAKEWADGVAIESGPDFDQVEKLRQTILEKNRLYFHRWRPQNETYLYGFRKHEQGQNAREIPLFDPLIGKLEKEIAALRKPLAHAIELIPAR